MREAFLRVKELLCLFLTNRRLRKQERLILKNEIYMSYEWRKER